MSAVEERFQLSNDCWICDKLFDVGDEKLSKQILVIFHNLRGLIIKEISKFDVKVSVIPNGLETYMAFTINRNLIFIDSMQFMNSSLDSLVKNLSENDFKCLSKEFSGEFLELVKQKRVYPYEYMDSF